MGRTSHRRRSIKKGVLKGLANFTEKKNMCWSLQACNFIKNRLQHRCFPKKIAKFLRTPIFANIYERSIFLVCSETIVLYYDC